MGQLGADGGDRKEIPPYKDHREPAMTKTDDDRIKFVRRISGMHQQAILNELIYAYDAGKNNTESYRDILQKTINLELDKDNTQKRQSDAVKIIQDMIVKFTKKTGTEISMSYIHNYDDDDYLPKHSDPNGFARTAGFRSEFINKKKTYDEDNITVEFSIIFENGFLKKIRNPLIFDCCLMYRVSDLKHRGIHTARTRERL